MLPMGVLFAKHPITLTLYQLLERGNITEAKEAISRYSITELAALPDSVLFDYYYLKAYITGEEGDENKKRAYLNAAKDICETSQGVHSPVYLEICWALGKSHEEAGDTLSAFEIYQPALIQSRGFYNTDDEDVKWQYEEIEDKLREWYRNDKLRVAMINNQSKLRHRTPPSESLHNDMEFYIRFYKDEEGKKIISVADSLMKDRKYEEAAKLYNDLARATYDNPIAKSTLRELAATCFIDIDDVKSAEALLLENLTELENYKKSKAYRRTLSLLSTLYNTLRNYAKGKQFAYLAKFWYEEALDFSRGYTLCLHRCAVLERGDDRHFISLLLADVALQEIYKNDTFDDDFGVSLSRNGFLSNVLSCSAVCYNQFGFLKEAFSKIENAIQIAEENNFDASSYYHNMVEICVAARDYDKAMQVAEKAYQLSNSDSHKIEIGTSLCFSQFLARKPISEAVYVETSRNLHTLVNETFSFTSMEERRDFWTHFQYYLPLLNFLAYQTGDKSLYTQIYNNILMEKGLLLRTTNRLREEILASGDSNDIHLYDQLLQLRKSLLTVSPQETETTNSEIQRLDKLLTRKFSAYEDFAQTNVVTWKDVQNNLNEGDIAIEFYNIPAIKWHEDYSDLDGKYRYCAVTLRKGYSEPHIIPLFTDDKLEGIDREECYETDTIYHLVWEPLEEELKEVKNIYFAADRELHKIGIEYVPMPKDGHIGDNYNIYRLSSTRVLTEEGRNRRNENAVLYGGLNYDMNKDDLIAESRSGAFHALTASRAILDENLRYGVKYLPGTLTEVNEIAENFATTPRLITDIAGTEESFKSLAGFSTDIIHLATHGFFWSDEVAKKRDYVTFLNPNNKENQSNEDKALMRSGLFFSGANIGLRGETLPDDVEDGVLTALELSNMNLGNVDMVVMSACESGLGETSGEGVFGLQRGFKLAGANTLLMSLWKVDDTATQLLMTEFYKNYLSGKSKQESLRLAQKTLRNHLHYSDPKYWAAFILLDGLN